MYKFAFRECIYLDLFHIYICYTLSSRLFAICNDNWLELKSRNVEVVFGNTVRNCTSFFFELNNVQLGIPAEWM